MSATRAVLLKDLRLLWRQRSGWLSAATFAAISVLTYSFALDLATGEVKPLLPGVLWVTFLFAGIIASGRSFAAEAEQGTFDALLVAPAPRSAIYGAKLLSNLIALLLIEVAVLVMATILFNTALLSVELIAIMMLGTLGYVSLTTLLSTLGSRVRSREVLIPVLALPLLTPLLIAAVRATGGALDLPTGGEAWLLLLAVFTAWSVARQRAALPLRSGAMSAQAQPADTASRGAATRLALFALRPVIAVYGMRWTLLPPLTGAAMLAMLVGAVIVAPREAIEGEVQRIFYIHVPSAIAAYLCFFVVVAASIALLRTRNLRFDAVARAAAGVGVLFTALTLATGAIWGKPIWGTWWAWDARLTSTLVLLLIYSGYLLARSLSDRGDVQAARYAAVFAIIGFVDIPIINLSVRWWRTLHPDPIVTRGLGDMALPNSMLVVLMLGMAAITLLALWLMALRSEVEQIGVRGDDLRSEIDRREAQRSGAA